MNCFPPEQFLLRKPQHCSLLLREATRTTTGDRETASTPGSEEYVQKEIKIAQLEAKLAQYRSYLERLRISIHGLCCKKEANLLEWREKRTEDPLWQSNPRSNASFPG
jgi:hypothetical protein